MKLFDDTFEKEILLAVDVPWTPRAKGRPRMTKSGRTYTPKETREAEDLFRANFIQEVGSEFVPIAEPIEVHWEFANDVVRMTVHSSLDYTERKLRGDLDNYVKLVSDALNGVAYHDDRLIVAETARKL